MRRLPSALRGALACALPLALAVACARGEEGADSSAAASQGAAQGAGQPAMLATPAARRSADGLPGRLTRPLEQYSPDEFHAFVQSLAFGGGVDKPRKCKKNPACAPGGQETSARIDAVEGQDSLSAIDVPVDGVVAVRLRNTGKFEESRYGMLPEPYEYYVVVLAGTGGGSTWGLHELTTTPGARKLRQVATGVFKPCNHAGGKPKPWKANFAGCEDVQQEADSIMKLGLALQGAQDRPAWVTCVQGCCVSE